MAKKLTDEEKAKREDAKQVARQEKQRVREEKAAKKAKAKLAKVTANDKAAKKATAKKAETEEQQGSVIKKRYKDTYRASKSQQSCDDGVVTKLADCVDAEGKPDLVALAKIAKTNGIEFSKWSHLNPGMQRMNFGNVLRGMIRRGEDVKFGKTKATKKLVGNGLAPIAA